MVEFLEATKDNLLAIRVEGKVEMEQFERFNPLVDTLLEKHDDPRFYLELLELEQVTPQALLEDIKNLPKYNQMSKVAVVGDARWKEWVTKALGVVMQPEARFFELEQKQEALDWVRQ